MTNSSTTLSRRQALKGLAAMATVTFTPSRLLASATAPSNQLTRAIIGCGGISASHLQMPGKLLALCDVDRHRLASRLNQVKESGNKEVKAYQDFREIIARKDIDIIHVATPPHWHAEMAIAAAKAGKAVWGEKPMSRTIGEGLAMKEAIAKAGTAFRLNTWFRFRDDFYGMGIPARQIRRAVAGGLLGAGPYKVTLSGVTGFNWKFNWVGRTDLTEEKVPAHFDYDFWLGPAPYKPYHPHRTHGTFRGYWDYDGGGLGDMGQHYLDPVQYILGKDEELPVSVEIDADPQDDDAVGTWRRITYKYADGCEIVLDGENKDQKAAFIEGPEGKIFKGFQSDITGFQEKVEQLPEPPAQLTDFHQAIREKKKFALNEINGFHSCTLVNLGKIAHRTNSNLVFDPEALAITNNEKANALIHQPDRAWR
ncbi:Gfo/Idh/MocA family oxidoreductase [Roseibacillus ishigakijimensis]|uniref:Gfo/Idh/MocA family oxidoreductase n=1 Tax=Roseibacillus ishigakijimensis TaxID=454146 RepID=A0A934VGC2_9BACT|nr:Gfo/Idh/MocA family oxidoreductase [Roseibacillus ishigakijimensis]MBK1832698.1 Gfo/Idh/MocA family oxidoreductase [Roseibacillus ishigakijimensis]